jgi:hypothetical protein
VDYLTTDRTFSDLSLPDLLRARDQFHVHLLHKANVVGTAVGRYLIRKTDPYPARGGERTIRPRKGGRPKPPRTLENSEIREYSWPCVLVFVSDWVDATEFGAGGTAEASDFIPKTIYLEDGRSVPICAVLALLSERVPPPIDPGKLIVPGTALSVSRPAAALKLLRRPFSAPPFSAPRSAPPNGTAPTPSRASRAGRRARRW